MCWQCETRDDDIAEHLDEIRDAVREHGWVIKCVDDTKRPYAYTTGLHQFGWPELIATGVTTERALVLLDHFVGEVKTGGPLRPGAHLDFLGVAAIEIVEVDQPDAHLGLAVALFGTDIRAVQLVWTDLSGPTGPGRRCSTTNYRSRCLACALRRLSRPAQVWCQSPERMVWASTNERTCHVLATRSPRRNHRRLSRRIEARRSSEHGWAVQYVEDDRKAVRVHHRSAQARIRRIPGDRCVSRTGPRGY